MLKSLETLRAGSTLEATVCIVGAGAAGITLACELDGAPFDVLLIEAGGLKPAAQASADYGGAAAAPHPDPSQFRRFVFGGTTGIWGGRCVPYEPIDFERRDYIANSGWPIGYGEVARFYPRALEYCDAGNFDFSARSAIANAPLTIAGFDGGGKINADGIERYSLPTDFGKKYRHKIERSANVTLVLNARALRLQKRGGEDRIEAVEVIDLAGRKRLVRAQAFVLCVGGIETPRLLLASDGAGTGLGNRTDRVGRFYACHFENCIGKLVPRGAAVVFDFEKTVDGVYSRRKLQFLPQTQRENRLLNMAFRLHFPAYSDAGHGSAVLSAIYLAKSALIPEYRNILQHGAQAPPASAARAHLANVMAGLPQMARFGVDWLLLRQLARRKLPYTLVANADGSFPLEFNSEQTPLESSRVSLVGDTDRHGMRRVSVDWFLSDDDVDAARRGFLLLRDVLRETSACTVELDEEHLTAHLRRSIPVGGHHIGTARMAATARDGVVDRHCALFELPNLYVASSAVFCTSGHANPTLTIVALAIRLAHTLRSTLAAQAAA
jgi:choline dehydrogenase-like flavoprotein